MKWLLICLLGLFIVAPAMAGEDPYIAVNGNDIGANGFYLSPKYEQFLYDETLIAGLISTAPGVAVESFITSNHIVQPEICDELGIATSQIPGQPGNYGPPFNDVGNPNFRIGGGNQGYFEWTVRLPKKPNGEINLCVQCGILKPDSFTFWGYSAVNQCAAETGERVASNCTRVDIGPGTNPLVITALPKVTATAITGGNSPFGLNRTFNLTAFRNPGTYNPFVDAPATAEIKKPPKVLADGAAGQILNGTDNGTRILLKSCMDKCIVVKLPITGQINSLGQTELALEAGDFIRVRLDVPTYNTVDVYCNAESLKVMGIGEANY